MTETLPHRLRIARVCVAVQCLLGAAAAVLGGLMAIFAAGTLDHDPENWSHLGLYLGLWLAAISVGASLLVLLLAVYAGRSPGARRGLLAVEVLIGLLCATHFQLAIGAGPGTLIWAAVALPAGVAITALAAMEPRVQGLR